MKKITALVLSCVMLLSLAACGSAKVKEEVDENGETYNAEIVNPIKEGTEKSVLEETGIDLAAPKGAKDVTYQTITADATIAQMSFTMDGKNYNYRVMSATEYSDISGMYYDWNTVDVTNVNGIIAEASYNPGEQGVITWFDVVSGLVYSLSVESGASTDVLANMANQLCTSDQAESEDNFSEVFADELADIQKKCEIGTAGSSLKAAALAGQLLDTFAQYKPNASDIQSAVSSYYISLGSKAKTEFAEQMNLVADIAEQLIGENGEGLLSDCGYEATNYPWDASVMSTYISALRING